MIHGHSLFVQFDESLAGARTVVGAPNSYYTIDPAFCQAKNRNKKNKFFFLKPLDKSDSLCYNKDTKREEQTSKRKEHES